jgi:hypothetical protein
MSDNVRKCLVVGLPNAGKSTYIGAFWAIEKDGGTGHTFTFEKYPSDIKYLNALKDNWLEQKAVDRTVQLSQDLMFDLERLADGEKLSVNIPDFKGEVFNQLLLGNSPDKLDEWIKDADSILMFIENCEEEIYSEEFGDDTSDRDIPSNAFGIEEIEPWIKVIQILKFLKEEKGDIPISICVSAWDKAINNLSEGDSVDSWLKEEHLFFYTFATHQFSNVRFFGVSAQGLDYDDRDADFTDKKVRELTEQKKRAYISSGTDKDYDITKPLAWLLED